MLGQLNRKASNGQLLPSNGLSDCQCSKNVGSAQDAMFPPVVQRAQKMILVRSISLYPKCDALIPEVEGPLYISVVLLLSLPTLLLRKENPLLLAAPSRLLEGALCCSRMGPTSSVLQSSSPSSFLQQSSASGSGPNEYEAQHILRPLRIQRKHTTGSMTRSNYLKSRRLQSENKASSGTWRCDRWPDDSVEGLQSLPAILRNS